MSNIAESSFRDVVGDGVGRSNAELVAEIRALEVQRRQVEARMSAACSVLEVRGGLPDGHRSLKGLLRAELNLSGGSAHRQRQIARLLDRFSQVGDAWLQGSIGRDQVVELARLWHHRVAKHCFADFVDQLLEAAIRFEFDDFMLVVQRFMLGADPDGAHDDRDTAVEGRSARLVVNGDSLDGSVTGGDPLVAHELKAVFDHFERREFRADIEARRAEWGDRADGRPLARTGAQRRFDAFVAMVRTAGTNCGADTSIDTTKPIADFCVNVVIDQERFEALLAERSLINSASPSVESALDDYQARIAGQVHVAAALDGRTITEGLNIAPRCEAADGTPLHPHDVLRAALTGHVRRVVVDSSSTVIDLGRKQRLFTGAARTAAQLLVTRCHHPGCDLPVEWCQVDHNVAWSRGGRTDQCNRNQLCGHHHRVKEWARFTYVTDRFGHRRAKRPDGSFVLAVGMPPPKFAT